MAVYSPIRRLFRIDWARTAPGPQVCLRFQVTLYLRDRGGRLVQVPWASEWEIIGERKYVRSGLADRRGYSVTSCPSLRNRRQNLETRRYQIGCEYCHRVFPSPSALVLHSPCPARFKVKLPGLEVRVQLLRKNAWVRTTEIDRLRDILLASLTEQAYRECLREFSPVPPFHDSRLSEKENCEHYRLYRFASFVDILRPGEIDWTTPSFSDMQTVRRIAARFLVLPVRPQRRVIRQLLAGRVHLQTLAGLRQKNPVAA